MPPRIGAELLLCGGQILIGPVVVETERRRRGQRYHMVALALRRDSRAECDLLRVCNGRLHKAHPLRDVRAVEPHRLQRGGVEQRRALRHRGRRIHAAVDRLLRQKNAPDLRRRCCWQCRCCVCLREVSNLDCFSPRSSSPPVSTLFARSSSAPRVIPRSTPCRGFSTPHFISRSMCSFSRCSAGA